MIIFSDCFDWGWPPWFAPGECSAMRTLTLFLLGNWTILGYKILRGGTGRAAKTLLRSNATEDFKTSCTAEVCTCTSRLLHVYHVYDV